MIRAPVAAAIRLARRCAPSRRARPPSRISTFRFSRRTRAALRTAMRVRLRRGGHRQRRGDRAALVPGGVGGQHQGRDLAGRGAGGLHGDRGVGAHLLGLGRGAHPGGDAARPAFGVGGQRRVVGAVVGGLVADDVDDAAAGAAGVVQAGEAVGEAGAAMQQGRRGLLRHAPIAVGGAGDDVLLQAEHAAHAGDAVERGDEVHLAGAGVGEADIHAAAEQRSHQAFGSVHTFLSSDADFGPQGARERRRRARLASERKAGARLPAWDGRFSSASPPASSPCSSSIRARPCCCTC